ncbi:helix-turn-helix domain-containing protein [Adlercreutzia sp. ZJ141]|uniref:helix-turn-helix domain-containing protein n=1 Tax=Adlercreutzia sp. ZJ141 TaxID=2709406 RepID=UPI0013EBD1D9|nr:helix-turn-helix transcriptional regulator [Adlercreutzia sp. ZJ141]
MVLESYERCRIQAGLSPVAAARVVGVPLEALMDFEQGRSEPDALVLKRMALAYGCTCDTLLGLVGVTEIGL